MNRIEVNTDGETFYRLSILSIISNCRTDIVHVLLAVGLKKAVIHVMNSLIARKRIIIHTMTMIQIIVYKAKWKNYLFLRGAN